MQVTVHNVLGQRVATLADQVQPSGLHSVKWDGRDYRGVDVSGGLYFYRLKAGDVVLTKKMLLLR